MKMGDVKNIADHMTANLYYKKHRGINTSVLFVSLTVSNQWAGTEPSQNTISDTDTIGGADENRTRVRKQIHTVFSERRLWKTFPQSKLHNQSYDFGSLWFTAEAEASSTRVHHLNDAWPYVVVIIGETTPHLGSVS